MTPQPEGKPALAVAIEWFHQQLDRKIEDHTDGGKHPSRPTTAWEWFTEVRGFEACIINEKRLGWAPPCAGDKLVAHLKDQGFDHKDILATGLFTKQLQFLWNGRYVFPYFDRSGEPVYAIGRCTGSKGGGDAGYDGHPADFIAGKYAKLAHTKDYVNVTEPIYGLESLERNEPVLITEGIADAIRAHEAGYACLSPVTTQFKHKHREALVDILEEWDVGTVYIVQDAERPTPDVNDDADGWDDLTVEQFGAGLKGGATTAGYLTEHGFDARLAQLPRPGLDKVDLDDYLNRWANTLDPVLASSIPAAQHPAYDNQDSAVEQTQEAQKAQETQEAQEEAKAAEKRAHNGDNALFDLDLVDVAPVTTGYRGPNPLGHHGNSENYFVVIDSGEVGYDHKYKSAYNALTYLLCRAGERRAADPSGTLDDSEIFSAWMQAKRDGHIVSDDPIPHTALRHFAVDRGLCDRDDLGDGWRIPREAYNNALEEIEAEFGVDPGRPPLAVGPGGRSHPIISCAPPKDDRESFDADAHREQLADDFRLWFDEGGIYVRRDPPGAGKTTTAPLTAVDEDEDHTILFDKHRKAREFVTDDPTPDDYYHLKGAEQPRDDVCMDAEHADGDCAEHGHPSNCPRMCSVYNRDPEDDLRVLYERLKQEIGPVQAHLLLDPHDGDDCEYLEQFDDVPHEDRVAGVHPYLQLQTTTDGQRVMVDEKPGALRSERSLSVKQLIQMSNELSSQMMEDAEARTLEEFGEFTRRIADVLLQVNDAPDTIDEMEPPTVIWDSYETYNDVAGHHRAYEEPEESWHLAEGLAKAKVRYTETVLRRVRRDEWHGTPLCFDALIAAAVRAGLDTESAMKAIAAPMTLSDCPRCRNPTEHDNGRRVCSQCGWDESGDTITSQQDEPARTKVWVDRPFGSDTTPTLTYESLPLADDLPDNAVVLDATATQSRIDTLFNPHESGDVTVEGGQKFDADMHVTQVLDGQYRGSTIEQSDALQDRFQRYIDTKAPLYDRPLFIIKGGLRNLFEFPDHGEVVKWHALRGLNVEECDAVFCLGAPHADVEDLKRQAELLAMHRDDVRVGGEEYSTRSDCSNPPVYRKLNFTDDNGEGLAVPTKAYSGLVGDLFRETREKEIEHGIHRLRPILAAETKDVHLLTNVPTTIPIDEVATLNELTDPLRSFLPVAEGAVRLLEYIRGVEAGDGPDGFRAEILIERDEDDQVVINKRECHRLAKLSGEDVTYKTVSRWVNSLTDVGILDPGEYEHRTGVRFTANPATLTQVLSVVSRNDGVKVSAIRRFRSLAERAGGSLRWLEWARNALGLTGEVFDLDPPSGQPG